MAEVEKYRIILDEGYGEIEEKKSRFICSMKPVHTEEEAIAFIEYCKKKYSDANHHVYAYVLRDNSLLRYSDDREPQGTAGVPVLDSIRKRGCTDTCVVVIRYFGGTLLGTGGLVRAYTSAAAGAIENAGVITYDVYSVLRIVTSYSDYQKLIPLFEKFKRTGPKFNDFLI